MSDNDNFKLVKNRKGRKRQLSSKLFQNNGHVLNIVDYNLSVETLIGQVQDAVVKFEDSQYKTVLLNGLFESLQTLGHEKFSQIICYGLGNFSYQRNAKYQLAALLSLKSHYNCDVYIYDPLFNSSEINALKLLKFNILFENEEGKRPIGDKVTLLFAIHCCKQLVNNFLYANWNENIRNCVIYGNSWEEIISNAVNKDLDKVVNYLLKIQPFVTEIELTNNFEYFETFSSSSLHLFPIDKLMNVNSDFWNVREEPFYSDQDIEFVRREQKILIES